MGDSPSDSLSQQPILASLPLFPPDITSTSGGVQNPGQAKLWKAIGDQYRRVPDGGENPAQFLQNLAHLQPGQHASVINHAAVFASNPQPQPNLAQTNPAVKQQEFGEGGAQKHVIQGLDRSSQPSNLQHLGSMLEFPTPQVLALTHKLNSLPVRDLEVWVSTRRENMPSLEARVRGLLEAVLRPGATTEIGAAYGRAKDELEQNQFLVVKAQEILTRRHIQANETIQAQAQANARAAAPLSSTLDGPAQPGSRAANPLQGQAPGAHGWQPQRGSSSTPQGSPRGTSPTLSQTILFPHPDAGKENQQAAFPQNGQQNKTIPHDRAVFLSLMQLWLLLTERNVDAIPKIDDKPLDLHQLHFEVETLGGVDEVQATGLWRQIAVTMGHAVNGKNDPRLAHAAKTLADTYIALLVPFNSFCTGWMHGVGDGGLDAPTMVNFQRVLTFLQITLKDWLPDLPPHTKLLRVAQMDLPAMQREGWPAQRIQIVERFRAALTQFCNAFRRQQQLQQQALSQRGMHHHNSRGQVQATQDQQSAQQRHIGDHRSHDFRSTGGRNPRYTPEVTVRARAIVMSMVREIEQTCQYQQREVPEIQRVQMGQMVVAAYPFAAEFERMASLHYMFFNDEQQTRSLLAQAALLREQHRIVESGQQRYIMTPVEVGAVQNSLEMAIHQMDTTYTRKLRQHHERMANLCGAEAGGPEMGQQSGARQVQQHMLQDHPHHRKPALAPMSDLGANAGLGGQLPQLVQQREPSQRRHGSHKPNPGKSSMGTVSQQQPETTPGTLDRPPGATLSPTEEPATPRLPKGGTKAPITPKKRLPARPEEYMRIELPPQTLDFNVFSKRQREDEVPPAAEHVLPTTGPLSSKRVKTGFHNGDPLESIDEALAKSQDVAPGSNGDGIDPDILAQLGGILDGTAPGPSGLVPPVLDQPPDALAGCSKVEDVFDFSHYLHDTAGGDDPLRGAGPLKADRPGLKEDMAEGTKRGIEINDSVSDARSNVDTQPGQISCEEIFRRLVKHGCVDLSSQLDPEQYSSGLIIGGAFGDIWKGKLRDGTEVAIKVWRFSSLLHNGWKSVKRAMREIYYWSKAKHEYVQDLMGVVVFQGRLGMVSRWMEHGNLREYICKNPSVDRYVLCMQVATGIAYLHSQAMVHGDLKGLNVLVSCDGVARLSDFDHSIMLGCSLAFSDTSKLGGGTTRWMAPELILEDNCSRSTYTDVYSLGMTMLEIITGTPPYYPQLLEDVQVIRAIMKKKLPTRPMDHLGDNVRGNLMWGLLLSCWNYDSFARPKAAEVVESLRNIMNLPTSSPV